LDWIAVVICCGIHNLVLKLGEEKAANPTPAEYVVLLFN